MHAYYEIETDIPINHQLNIRLPDTIPSGRAKIAVIYEVNEPLKEASTSTLAVATARNIESDVPHSQSNMLDFLGAGKAYSRFTSIEAVDTFIAQQREDWDYD